MNIFIAGGTGFIGRNLKEYFEKEGHFVLAPPRGEVNWLDYNSFINFRDNYYHKNTSICFDAFIQCAGIGGKRDQTDEIGIIAKNVTIAENVYRASQLEQCPKFFHFGSGAEQDRNKGVSNMIYPSAMPQDYYGISKRAIEERFAGVRGTCNLRTFGVFGNHEELQRFIRTAIHNYKFKLPIVIHHDKRMDFFNVNDIGPTLECLIKVYPPEKLHDVNLSYPERMLWLSEIAEFINTLDSHEVEIIKESKITGKDYFGNSIMIKNLLKNCPELELIGQKEGIRRLYEL